MSMSCLFVCRLKIKWSLVGPKEVIADYKRSAKHEIEKFDNSFNFLLLLFCAMPSYFEVYWIKSTTFCIFFLYQCTVNWKADWVKCALCGKSNSILISFGMDESFPLLLIYFYSINIAHVMLLRRIPDTYNNALCGSIVGMCYSDCSDMDDSIWRWACMMHVRKR